MDALCVAAVRALGVPLATLDRERRESGSHCAEALSL